MKTLKELKQRLQNVSNNDVKATATRITDAKEKAKEAKNNSEEARGRALDLLKKVNDISLPNLGFPQLTDLTGDQDINVAAERIQKEADKLQLKLEHLENQFNDRKEIIDNR